jgi:hypothetical protein
VFFFFFGSLGLSLARSGPAGQVKSKQLQPDSGSNSCLDQDMLVVMDPDSISDSICNSGDPSGSEG